MQSGRVRAPINSAGEPVRVPSSRRTDTAVTMMLLSLFPAVVLLLSLRAARVDGVAAPPLTFKDTDRMTGASLECDRCPPGTYLRARCTSTQKSQCAPCPSGSFTELWNYIGKCLRCDVCGQNQVVKRACTADSNCHCECKQGYYYKTEYDMCIGHSACPVGEGVLSNGTADKDTVCHDCPNGTFSDTASAHRSCVEHRSCNASGLQLVLKGSTWHDSMCTSCGQDESRDGADHLKEILSIFFVHQKMHMRRLRQIVQRLQSKDRKRRGRTSRPNVSALHGQIDAWVTSATAGQIRHLPAILRKAGAKGAAERIENKLQRIDSRLSELCALGNEVEVVLTSG